MNGTRTYTGAGAAYDLRYPDTWTVAEQSGTVAISPEQGTARVAGFLFEPVANPKVSPEQDLRDAIMPTGSTGTSIMATGPITPVMVAGEPGFRADVRISGPGTPAARGSATAASLMYVGSIVITSHKGVNYRIGLFARDGDTATLMQTEQILASLHFT